MNKERRENAKLRRIVMLGNCLSLWAGVEPKTPEETQLLNDLFNSWEEVLGEIREEKKAEKKT